MRLPLLFLALVVTCGSLGDPYLPDEIPFSHVEREHFTALAVLREQGPATDAPLVLRLNIVGDASDASIDDALAWLREHAGVHVVRDPNGAPLFLTTGDLTATSGRSTLGATVRAGMAAEVSDERIGPCVVAHEILHFVGLKHVDEKSNIMYPHCLRDALEKATLDDDQRAQLAQVDGIRATTMRGVVVWASR